MLTIFWAESSCVHLAPPSYVARRCVSQLPFGRGVGMHPDAQPFSSSVNCKSSACDAPEYCLAHDCPPSCVTKIPSLRPTHPCVALTNDRLNQLPRKTGAAALGGEGGMVAECSAAVGKAVRISNGACAVGFTCF